MTEAELRRRIIALWNGEGGWIPGAAYRDLARILGVDVNELIHYDFETRRHHYPGRPKALPLDGEDTEREPEEQIFE